MSVATDDANAGIHLTIIGAVQVQHEQCCGGSSKATAVLPVLQQGASNQWPTVSACCTLAGLVRLLRKVFSQLSGKNREFVTHSLKFEKNAAQQVRYSLPECLVSWQPYCRGLLLHHRTRCSTFDGDLGHVLTCCRSKQ